MRNSAKVSLHNNFAVRYMGKILYIYFRGTERIACISRSHIKKGEKTGSICLKIQRQNSELVQRQNFRIGLF